MMTTSFPDLPYRCIQFKYGNSAFRSTTVSSARRHPRTDLKHFLPWTTFDTDIEKAISDAMARANIQPGKPLTVPTGEEVVWAKHRANSEESLRYYARMSILTAVSMVLDQLGYQGEFCPVREGNTAMIGEPDFCWVEMADTPQHPKFVVEFKTKWTANLDDLPACLNKPESDLSRKEKQSIDALEQTYSYMTFNNNKYGVLTNWDCTWFFRRVEKNDGKTLEFSGPLRFGQNSSPSMLKVWVGVVLLAECDWFHASPTPSTSPPRRHFSNTVTGRSHMAQAIWNAGSYAVVPASETYPLLNLDFRLCDFQLSATRKSLNGCVVDTHLLWNHTTHLHAICKVVDSKSNPAACISLETEVAVYAALAALQGTVIPKLYGYYSVWRILRLIALEPVGRAITKQDLSTPGLQNKLKMALGLIHAAGYIHGDVARRNFCIRGSDVFVIDLERSVPTENKGEMESEMKAIDSWFAQGNERDDSPDE